MCGIAGILAKKHQVQRPLLQNMAKDLGHRGPDDEGVEIIDIDNGASLGLVHRRLSIIDLSPGGHQPMRDKDTGNWIVYNGEIYNYKEIKIELEKKGRRFSSESDTEVILKAYTAYGVECLGKLRGMFAFALWDAKQQQLFLAVDRFGIKPLYVYHKDGVLAFASETKTLLATGIVPREVEPAAVHSFLSFGAVQAPLTMIKDIRAMLPAQYLVYEVGGKKVKTQHYWSPRPYSDGQSFDKVLENTVRAHLVSDVPVGLFLSGGVDSSALAILVNRVAGRALDSFSVTFEEEGYAEGHYARVIGEKFCARHHELKISDSDLEKMLPAALAAQDQPTIDGINAYVISKTVRETDIKTVLSGQGGDEVFGGYNTFRRILMMKKMFGLAKRIPSGIISKKSVFGSKLAQYLNSDGDILSFYYIARQLFSPEQIQRIVLHDQRGLPFATFHGDIGGLDLFNQISLLELRGYLANMLLRDGDVMSMAHGLEVRVPYLDHKLVEYVFNIPAAEKMDKKLPKVLLLRQVINDMPREIWARKKMGFTFPWEVWLRGRLREQVSEVFHDARAAEVMGLDINTCQNLWKRFLNQEGNIIWSRVWGLYVLLRWAARVDSLRA